MAEESCGTLKVSKFYLMQAFMDYSSLHLSQWTAVMDIKEYLPSFYLLRWSSDTIRHSSQEFPSLGRFFTSTNSETSSIIFFPCLCFPQLYKLSLHKIISRNNIHEWSFLDCFIPPVLLTLKGFWLQQQLLSFWPL